MQRNNSRTSDEGYNSDLPSPIRDFTRKELRIINKEAKEFKEKYVIESMINNSANGVIYQGFRRSDMTPICVKQVPKTRVSVWVEYEGRTIPKEFKMHLKAQQASGVVKVFDWYERKTSFVLIMEKPKFSIDLFELSRSCGAITEPPARIVFRQIVETCKNLHELGVLHRDIKDENILINTETLEIKMIDFGCATEYNAETIYTQPCGTPEFFPPEIFVDRQYRAEASTVWTLGTLLYVILLGDIPFEIPEEITSGKRQASDLENKLSEPAQALLNRMLCNNPDGRPTLSDVLGDQWFNL